MSRAPKFTPVTASDLAPAPVNLFAGTSGWAYPSWKPGFYPADLPSRGFLHFYASQLTSVEVNYTFNKLPTAVQLQGWLAATPAGFRFSFKAPQRITHFERLRESETSLAEFLTAIAPARRAKKLGPLLFQLPPNFKADTARLAAFLSLPAFRPKKLQLAFEFRHPSWFVEPVYAILRRHKAALCVAESDTLTTPEVHTADHCCYRLRREGGYSRVQIKTFAERFTSLASTREVFVYFKHEDQPTGALNASALLGAAAMLAEKAVR